MRKLVVLLAAFAALAAGPAAPAPAPAAPTAAAGTRLEGPRVRVTVPPEWTVLPDAVKKAFTSFAAGNPDVTGDAIGYGDTRAGVFGVLLWIDSVKPAGGTRVRGELDGFVTGLKKSLEDGKITLSRWDVVPSARRMTVHLAGKLLTVEITGLAVSVVDVKGHVHGYLAMCLRTGDAATKPKVVEKATAGCDAMIGSFELTWKDAELKKLEKK